MANFKRDEVTIVSLDIKDMYPQCHCFKVVNVAVKYYASVLPTLQRKGINKCLDILHFSMGNTVVLFQDKYYKYGVNDDPNCCGLTIGRFNLHSWQTSKQCMYTSLAPIVMMKLLSLEAAGHQTAHSLAQDIPKQCQSWKSGTLARNSNP
jgi:hypothetical protein